MSMYYSWYRAPLKNEAQTISPVCRTLMVCLTQSRFQFLGQRGDKVAREHLPSQVVRSVREPSRSVTADFRDQHNIFHTSSLFIRLHILCLVRLARPYQQLGCLHDSAPGLAWWAFELRFWVSGSDRSILLRCLSV